MALIVPPWPPPRLRSTYFLDHLVNPLHARLLRFSAVFINARDNSVEYVRQNPIGRTRFTNLDLIERIRHPLAME